MKRTWSGTESEVEPKIYKEDHDVLPMFRYVVETSAGSTCQPCDPRWHGEANGSVFFEVEMKDAWVWDMFRPARFLSTSVVDVPRRERRRAGEARDLDLTDQVRVGKLGERIAASFLTSHGPR